MPLKSLHPEVDFINEKSLVHCSAQILTYNDWATAVTANKMKVILVLWLLTEFLLNGVSKHVASLKSWKFKKVALACDQSPKRAINLLVNVQWLNEWIWKAKELANLRISENIK